MTRQEIKQDMGDDKYLNSFKARRYIEFLLAECDEMEARAKREHEWAKAAEDTTTELKKELDRIKRKGKRNETN